ncbi:hypothetical protein [Paenibacillus kyungheensis]
MSKNFFRTVFLRQLLLYIVVAVIIYVIMEIMSIKKAPFLPITFGVEGIYIFTIKIESIYLLREFILNLFFRIVPILVPIVIGTSSLMLNRYTSAYFNLIFEDKKIRRLVQFCLSYLFFHVILIFHKSISYDLNTEQLQKTFFLQLTDTMLATLILGYAIYTSINIFLYSQPSKISTVILEKASDIAEYLKKDLKRGIKNEIKFNQNKIFLNRYISTFTNLLVIAVKSKDYETIKNNIEKIGNTTWDIIKELKNSDKDNFPKRKRNDLEFQSLIINEANDLIKELEQLPPKFYIDTFESAFVNKEFYVCDEIINYFNKNAIVDTQNIEYILEIFPSLFKTSLSYNYHGYTSDYCEKIVDSCYDIYDKVFKNKKLILDYDVFLNLLKHSIYHRQFHILNIIMNRLQKVIKLYANDDKYIYENIVYSGIYCLEIKSMTCFSYLLRAMITFGFDIDKINNAFSSIFSEEHLDIYIKEFNETIKEILFEFSNDIEKDNFLLALKNVEIEYSKKNIFDSNKTKHYLYLKMYILFYSYYKLQLKISLDRIPEHCREVSTNLEFIKKIEVRYNFIRTLLLDLESHEKNWNSLFINQFEFYLIESVKEVFCVEEKALLQEELKLFSNSTYLKILYKKIYWSASK